MSALLVAMLIQAQIATTTPASASGDGSPAAVTMVEAAVSSSTALRPAIPANYPGTWVTTNDYPVRALHNMEQGATGFSLTVDRRGHVASCLVTESSGSLDLDEATCRLVADRARFVPATDGKGRPVAGSYTSRIHWVLPSARNALQPGSLRFSFTIEGDGAKKDCMVAEAVGGVAANAQAGVVPCAMIPFNGRYTDDNGNGVRKRVTITQTVTVDDAK